MRWGPRWNRHTFNLILSQRPGSETRRAALVPQKSPRAQAQGQPQQALGGGGFICQLVT